MAAPKELGRLSVERTRVAETARLHALLDGTVVQVPAQPPRLNPQRARDILARHLTELSA